jgi:hypothetical protein
MNPQDEIKARLEVAQLYDEMGQQAKAARYYLAAAEIALKAKLFDQGRGFLEKVLSLEPENKEARNYLDRLNQHLAAHGMGPANAASAASAPASGGGGGLTIPTPSVYLRRDQVAAILSQVASAPNPKFFPYNPLPKVDERAIEQKSKMAEAKREEQRAKERTAVESSFSKGPSAFAAGGLGLFGNQSGGRRKEREKDKPAAAAEEPRRARRGANMDLAESIRRKLQGG